MFSSTTRYPTRRSAATQAGEQVAIILAADGRIHAAYRDRFVLDDQDRWIAIGPCSLIVRCNGAAGRIEKLLDGVVAVRVATIWTLGTGRPLLRFGSVARG